ncbi:MULTISPECIES: hypothetical protein [unclassified Streptomyces]|uniref:hypothetical protein n=1 Tax=unclassified Streptomyces TaxID=2593676 RepID=UPI002E27F664|nr:hypothetical protein [Streptomyces sp. NBC_01423]WSX95141.1 hypothetical protein OH827_33420 [Streptomyces sp. NBC_00891]WSY09621.1 hypothetical protein OG464_33425 [Streptomyces sp. NBC_00890]WSZ11241.1 hypothetical protein OG704_33425 [Streptomyces sp. NBC_00869]WSZ21254.1 hypothetical protein OG498_00145 [Streptomyces sp. NBC_00870]
MDTTATNATPSYAPLIAERRATLTYAAWGAARSYYAAHSTLACPRNAVWDGVALGQ